MKIFEFPADVACGKSLFGTECGEGGGVGSLWRNMVVRHASMEGIMVGRYIG